MASLNQSVLSRVRFPIPPLPEQRAIAEALSDVDGLLASLDRLIAKKRALKQGAMQQLLTGRTRLPGFDGEWETKRLGELFEFKNGLNKAKGFFGHGTPIVNYMDVYRASALLGSHQVLGRVEVSKQEMDTFGVRQGDVLFTRTSETVDEVGIASVMLGAPRNTVFSGFLLRARPKSDLLCASFKRYCFASRSVREQIVSCASYTTRALTNGNLLSGVTLRFPPLPEQRAIAAVLSDMDGEIEELEARRDKTKAVKQGMMQQLLTGRIRLVEPQAAPKTTTAHNTQIDAAVVLSVLVKEFGSEEFPMGRFRRTKFAYLLERHAKGTSEGYLKKAAGPYKPEAKYRGPEGIAKKNGYVREHGTGKHAGFVAADNIAQAEQYFEAWYGAETRQWIQQFRYRKNDDLELLTTVDMAVQDLRAEGKPVDVATVRELIANEPEWRKKLSRGIFADENISRAIEESRRLFG